MISIYEMIQSSTYSKDIFIWCYDCDCFRVAFRRNETVPGYICHECAVLRGI